MLDAIELPSLILVGAWLLVLNASRRATWQLALVSLPGTWAHELAHYVAGVVLGAKPTSLSLWPRREGDRIILGSVGFARLNLWNSGPVGLAPLILLPGAGLAAEHWLAPAFASSAYLSWVLAGYVCACLLFSCIPSSTDIRVGGASALLWGAGLYGLWSLAY